MKPLKTTMILAATLFSLGGLAAPASAQYYGGYGPVYRTMPVPRTYARPHYRGYVRPYPGPSIPRPYIPSPTFPRGGRTSGYVGAPPYRPVPPPSVCRGVRSTVCYGGPRPGVR